MFQCRDGDVSIDILLHIVLPCHHGRLAHLVAHLRSGIRDEATEVVAEGVGHAASLSGRRLLLVGIPIVIDGGMLLLLLLWLDRRGR